MDPVTLLLLSFPLGIAANLGAEVLLKLKKGIKWKDLESLFIKSFLNALKDEDKNCKGGLKEFRGKINKNKQKILELFTADATIEKVGLFFTEIKTEEFQKRVAERIVKEFPLGDNFYKVLVIIVKQCLENYEKSFLDTMKQEEGIKLIFKEQLHQTSELQTITILVRQVLLEKASKDDLKAYYEELKGLMEKLIRIVSEGKVKARIPKEPVKEEEEKKQKQIKILSITASPKDDLVYELEQDTLLDGFRSFDRDEVYLDIPDPVKDTLTEIETYLEEGHHDVLYLSAHGSIDKGGKGILHFENERGEEIEVTGTELLEVLKPTPNIVILSACHSARKEPELMSVAHTLFKGGINTVIGMKQAISNDAAIEFNMGFFKALLEKETVKKALDAGKEAILKWEQQKMRENRERQFKEEHEIPELLTRDENLTVDNFSDFRIEAPGRPESHHFLGARYLERGFIGRRQVLRDIFKSIDNKEGAVVLKGPGGIGKSTLTTRTAANLLRKGYEFIVVQGDTTIEQILDAICKKAAALEVKDAEKIYESNAEPNEKLAWYLDQFLLKQKVVLILDNFEENQVEEKGGEFKRERLKKFLWFFRDSLKHHETFLFFSTRYALPGFDSPDITRNIPEFSSVEFRKMLLNSKALKSLESKSVKTLMEEIGGNPRALDLLDRIAYKKYKQRDFTWEQLKDLIPKLQERIIQKRGRADAFTPLFLDTLFSYLSKPQRHLLDVLSIYRNPVPEEAITAQDVVMEEEDRTKLEDLSLLECIDVGDKELYYVHRLTALCLLEQMKAAERKRYFKKAAGYFEALKVEEGKVLLDDLIEARWHYLQAGEWNKAAEITFSLEDYLSLRGYPQWAMELLQELDVDKLKGENQHTTHLELGNLYKNLGEYEKAHTHYNMSKEVAEKISDSIGIALSLQGIGMVYHEQGRYNKALNLYEKSREILKKTDAKKQLSGILHQIGNVHYLKGDYEAALKEYQKSHEIREKIEDIKGVADSLGQIGHIYFNKGDYSKALKKFQESIKISEKLGDIKTVSKSLHNIGMIYQDKGEYEAALTYYQKSMEIKEKIGDIKGVSSSLHQIGIIYQYKGDYEVALTHYQKSLEIKEKIGDIRGVSLSLHQIGMIYQLKGDYEAALTHYQKSMEIKEKIGDIAGTASSMAQMGQVLSIKGQYKNALKLCIQSYLIFVKLESPNAKIVKGFIKNIREKLPEEQFNAILKEFNLPPDFFDKMEAEEQQEQLMAFLTAITKDAVSASASEKSSGEKEKMAAQLNQLIEKLPDAPEAEGLKNYFQLLLAMVNGEEYQAYLEKVPEQLKEVFEKT